MTVVAPPVAGFTFTTSDLTGSFTDTSTDSDCTIEAWSWDFGDGAASTVQNPAHTYGAGGTYTVTLTVTGNDGASVSLSQAVTVNAPPDPADVVTIDEAVWSDGTLEVFAFSTDPTATLTVQGFGVMQNLGDGEYELIASGVPVPTTVTVTSDKGGRETATVEMD